MCLLRVQHAASALACKDCEATRKAKRQGPARRAAQGHAGALPKGSVIGLLASPAPPCPRPPCPTAWFAHHPPTWLQMLDSCDEVVHDAWCDPSWRDVVECNRNHASEGHSRLLDDDGLATAVGLQRGQLKELG